MKKLICVWIMGAMLNGCAVFTQDYWVMPESPTKADNIGMENWPTTGGAPVEVIPGKTDAKAPMGTMGGE